MKALKQIIGAICLFTVMVICTVFFLISCTGYVLNFIIDCIDSCAMDLFDFGDNVIEWVERD